MALEDAIRREIEAGRLQRHWTTSDLVANQSLSSSHPKTTLRSYPPNVSGSLSGLDLGEGHNAETIPVFYRVGRRGRALLFALREHSYVSWQEKLATPAPSVAKNKRTKNHEKSDTEGQPDNKWSVESEHVSKFIDWVVNKEKNKLFQFSYDMNGNTLKASSIFDAAKQYRWPTRPSSPIPNQLVAHLNTFPQGDNNLDDTVSLLGLLRNELRDSLRQNDSIRHLKACWATLYWGGVANGGNLSFYGLRYISDCNRAPDGLIAYHNAAHNAQGWFDPATTTEKRLEDGVKGMSAGITKIHSLLADELVIYDSRVACAVAWLVERYCDFRTLSEVPKELLFSIPKEKTGRNSPVRRDPALVRPANSLLKTEYQNPGRTPDTRRTDWPRDKLRVSLILSAVLTRLGTEDRRDSFLKYQLGLFMIGYHLGDHSV